MAMVASEPNARLQSQQLDCYVVQWNFVYGFFDTNTNTHPHTREHAHYSCVVVHVQSLVKVAEWMKLIVLVWDKKWNESRMGSEVAMFWGDRNVMTARALKWPELMQSPPSPALVYVLYLSLS